MDCDINAYRTIHIFSLSFILLLLKIAKLGNILCPILIKFVAFKRQISKTTESILQEWISNGTGTGQGLYYVPEINPTEIPKMIRSK